MDPWQQLDLYCERLDFAWLSEPLNLTSNISFFLAAWFIQRETLSIPQEHRSSAKIMYILIYCIGIGSSLFHAFANLSTMALDVIPISLYIIYYLWHWNTSIMRYSIKKSCIIMGIWLVTTLFMTISLKNQPLNGSQSYLSIAFFLPWMAHQQKNLFIEKFKSKDCSYHSLLDLGSMIFILSLMFRSIDPNICGLWPYGTHFLWHLCNGIVLFLTAANCVKFKNFWLNNPEFLVSK